MNEMKLDKDSFSDIEMRLDSLKGRDASKVSKSKANLAEDTDSVTKRLIKKALAEAALERKHGDIDIQEQSVQECSNKYF